VRSNLLEKLFQLDWDHENAASSGGSLQEGRTKGRLREGFIKTNCQGEANARGRGFRRGGNYLFRKANGGKGVTVALAGEGSLLKRVAI